jgi:predicted transposase/invertase (TIGR01784 family)
MSNPHDHLVQKAFSDPQVARAFLERVLPAEALAALDLRSLRLPTPSLLGELEKERFTDLLLEVDRKDGSALFLRIVLEHQSTPDPRMARRLLRYMHLVWDHLESKNSKEKLLAPIVSIVLYHGKRRWPGTRHLHDEVALDGLPEALVRQIPNFAYTLVDLRRLADVRLAGSAFGTLVLLALKHVADRDLWERLPRWRDLLLHAIGEPGGTRAISLLMSYLLYTMPSGPTPAVKDFIRSNLGEPVMDTVETWADKLRQEGLTEGEKRGSLAAARRSLQRLATRRFGTLAPHVIEALNHADAEQLDAWLDHVLTATTADELIRPVRPTA